jgi:hypothetical protein
MFKPELNLNICIVLNTDLSEVPILFIVLITHPTNPSLKDSWN